LPTHPQRERGKKGGSEKKGSGRGRSYSLSVIVRIRKKKEKQKKKKKERRTYSTYLTDVCPYVAWSKKKGKTPRAPKKISFSEREKKGKEKKDEGEREEEEGGKGHPSCSSRSKKRVKKGAETLPGLKGEGGKGKKRLF